MAVSPVLVGNGTVVSGCGKQAEHRRRDEQPVGAHRRRQAERTGQRPGLSIRQLAEMTKDRPQQFV